MIRHHDDVIRLADRVRAGRLSRREFFARTVAAGFSLTMASAFLAPGRAGAAPARSLARQTQPKQGGQVIVGFSQEPTVFNPLKSTLEVDRGVQYSLFDSLWRIDDKGALIPNLATELPSVANGGIAKDGLSYTFKLRDDAKWHDGQPFTAKDVLFSHATIMNPDFAAGNRIGHDKITDISAPDDHTVTMKLSEAYAPFLIVWMDTYLIPEHLLKDVKDLNTADFNSTAPVGTGPFKWVERVPGDHITVKANPDYHGEGPYLDQIIFKYVPDLTVFFTQFKTGEIDATGIQGITADNYAEAQTLQGKTIYKAPSPFVEFIYMNFGKPVFQDKAVREAMYAAMDKQNIIDKVYYGLPAPSETYLPEASWAFDPDLPAQKFDIEHAKQVLDAAGWKPGADGVREKDGVKLSFTTSTTAGNKVREQAQQYLQQTWKEAGIDMQINNMPAAVIWGDYYNKSQYDTVMIGLNAGLGSDPEATTRFGSNYIPAQGGGGQNTMQYKNPDLDKLLDAGAKELDQDQRKAIYFKVQEILRNDLAYLPIFHYITLEGTKEGLQEYKPSVFVVSNQWNTNVWSWA
ncbi:MAG TPA: peptide ABC transporter substrate-binding protein [Thermomicrobiales bacterium]|nr:peptide ABC transporter substrate-binding protein [Thermomicrobiales bacterium]